MQALHSYDEASASNIIAHGTRIRDVVVKLSELDHEVHLHRERGLANLIEVARSLWARVPKSAGSCSRPIRSERAASLTVGLARRSIDTKVVRASSARS